MSRLRLAIGALLLLCACGIKAPPKPPVRQPQPAVVPASAGAPVPDTKP